MRDEGCDRFIGFVLMWERGKTSDLIDKCEGIVMIICAFQVFLYFMRVIETNNLPPDWYQDDPYECGNSLNRKMIVG